jgi:RNA polymerase sigma-70 factor (ECF subfamily)
LDKIGTNINIELRSNKREAYKLLFRKYYMDMLYYAMSFGISLDDSKDLTQAAFVKLWENRTSIQDDKTVKYYLLSILKNNCLDFLKHAKVVQEYTIVQQNERDSHFLVVDSPHEKMIEVELELKILKAISGLPERCRRIFELSRLKGLKNKEISKKLNISIKTVENQMTIALERIRGQLTDYLPLFLLVIFNF